MSETSLWTGNCFLIAKNDVKTALSLGDWTVVIIIFFYFSWPSFLKSRKEQNILNSKLKIILISNYVLVIYDELPKSQMTTTALIMGIFKYGYIKYLI